MWLNAKLMAVSFWMLTMCLAEFNLDRWCGLLFWNVFVILWRLGLTSSYCAWGTTPSDPINNGGVYWSLLISHLSAVTRGMESNEETESSEQQDKRARSAAQRRAEIRRRKLLLNSEDRMKKIVGFSDTCAFLWILMVVVIMLDRSRVFVVLMLKMTATRRENRCFRLYAVLRRPIGVWHHSSFLYIYFLLKLYQCNTKPTKWTHKGEKIRARDKKKYLHVYIIN